MATTPPAEQPITVTGPEPAASAWFTYPFSTFACSWRSPVPSPAS